MRNAHLFEQFMKENELEFDVPFKIIFKPTIGETDFDTVYIHKDDNRFIGFTLNYADTDEEVEGDRFDILDVLFSDRMKIIKKPWHPKGGEDYWYVSVNGNITQANFDCFSTICFANYVIGNVFRTREEALDHMNDVLKVLHGEPLIKWEK